jgi:hypothetical protein
MSGWATRMILIVGLSRRMQYHFNELTASLRSVLDTCELVLKIVDSGGASSGCIKYELKFLLARENF